MTTIRKIFSHSVAGMVIMVCISPCSNAAIHAQTLLLGGSNGPKFLKTALDALAAVMPTAQRVEIRKVGHAASWNADRGGKPALVAQELRRFFGEAGS